MKNGDLPAMPFTNEPFAIGAISSGYGPMAIGLSKREMFAMAAMQGLCSHSGDYQLDTHLAQDAVMYADALLSELERTK